MTLCAIHWCSAETAHGSVYCPIHAKWPTYDPRNDYERAYFRETKGPQPPSFKPRKVKPEPVDERPIIRAIEGDAS